MNKLALVVIVLSLCFPLSSWARDYYGSLQYSDASTGITHIVFQSSDSKMLCEALNKNYWRGLRTSCPQCEQELSGCDTDLPSAYRDIFKDKPAIFPYVSAPYMRIVIFGVPLQQSRSICNMLARWWKQGMNQPAKCIYK